VSIPVDRIFALASQKISQRVAATWHPSLPRTPRVLVPVNLEVMMVRQTGGAWARTGMSSPPAGAQQPVDIKTLLPAPFQPLEAARPQGAYLHWALPDALTSGTSNVVTAADGSTSSQTSFPAIPDRWLVLRLSPSKVANRRTIRGWILQAGDPNPVPLPLDGWKEPGTTQQGIKKPLTALGHGDMTWAAYYDNVVNRLGFYDKLDDVPVGPIAYVVCGWFSDETLDPLNDATIHSLADFNARMQALKWSLPDTDFQEAANNSAQSVSHATQAGLPVTLSASAQLRATAALDARSFKLPLPGSVPDGPPYVTNGWWWPQHTLYHGSVLGIGWPSIGWPGNEQGTLSGEEGGPPDPGTLKVAIGNTMGETMAKLIALANNSASEERILEAFQLSALTELDKPDGQARLDVLLHTSAFGAMSGGETTERVWQPPIGTPPSSPSPAPGLGIFERYHRPTHIPNRAVTATLGVKKSLQESAPPVFQAKSVIKESTINLGRLSAVVEQVHPQQVEPFQPGKWVDVPRALPRLFHPVDPVIVLQGVKRSFRFGFDGQYTPEDLLECRLSGTCIKSFMRFDPAIAWLPVHPEDILDRGVENGSVPPECEELLGEATLLDPGSSAHVVQSGTRGLTAQNAALQTTHVMTEQTAWWSLRDPRVDHGPLLSKVSFTGMLPAPIAVTPPVHPWSPVHLEWRIQFIPSAGGAADWQLGEIDFNESVPKLPPSVNPLNTLTLEGRSPLTSGASATLAAAVRQSLSQIANSGGMAKLSSGTFSARAASMLSQTLMSSVNALTFKPGVFAAGNVAGSDRSQLEDIATALDSMDVLAGGFNGLLTQLRGGVPGDGASTTKDGTVPSSFFALRSGFLHVLRLRLVDSFGQFVDLAGSSDTATADPAKLAHTDPLDVTGRPELLALPPRFTSPARLWLRFMDASGGPDEARLATDKQTGISPVCGYLMPNHLDSALEFFGVDGANLGVVRTADDNSVLWEDAPGTASTAGQSPLRSVPNSFVGELGDALIRWGTVDAGTPPDKDTALKGLLRVIDSTLWSVDPFGHQGDEHLSLLVGHPIVVMRARLRLELREPVDPTVANVETVPVRLGALAQWQDGLLGYFVDDDYTRLYCSDAAAAGLAREIGPGVGFLQQANLTQEYFNQFAADIPSGTSTGASPVKHPYIDTSGIVEIHPNQEVNLTLLMEPHTYVHATCGFLPRKEVGMRREWVTDALARLAPTFRFGPVLIDPKNIRMPIAAELNGTWSWDHRRDVSTWVNDPVTHATQDALLSPDPPMGSEGWLRLTPEEPKNP
jgi:hypothetical protein